MPTTAQMLAEYPIFLLAVLAELRSADVDGVRTREEAIAQIKKAIETAQEATRRETLRAVG